VRKAQQLSTEQQGLGLLPIHAGQGLSRTALWIAPFQQHASGPTSLLLWLEPRSACQDAFRLRNVVLSSEVARCISLWLDDAGLACTYSQRPRRCTDGTSTSSPDWKGYSTKRFILRGLGRGLTPSPKRHNDAWLTTLDCGVSLPLDALLCHTTATNPLSTLSRASLSTHLPSPALPRASCLSPVHHPRLAHRCHFLPSAHCLASIADGLSSPNTERYRQVKGAALYWCFRLITSLATLRSTSAPSVQTAIIWSAL
jgi:hypothetical protein